MTTTETTARALDTTDLRALRNADSIVYRLYQGRAAIEANLDARNSATGFNQKHTIDVAATITDYGKESGYWGQIEKYSAFYMTHNAKYARTIPTTLARLRKGDTLTLEWTRGNDTENLRDVGYHTDELILKITHPNGKHERYHIAHQTGPDNTARMIKLA